MKTFGWLWVGTIVVTAGCGGTVVFEEDGSGGSGASGPTGPGTGGGATTNSGPTTTTEVGPTSTSTGTPGCGSLNDDLGLPIECRSCMDNECCSEARACDEGTACYRCIFEGTDCEAGQANIEAFSNCLQNRCFQACNGGNCGPGEFECPESGQCIPERWVCDGAFDCPQGGDEFCGCGPDSFQCFESGECIPFEWQCDGFADCADGTDEQFCGGGVCDSGFATGDQQLDQCLGDFCCDEFNQCTNFAGDVQGCIDCFNQGGGPQCLPALDCAQASPCIDQPGEGICDSGLTTGDPGIDQCLGDACCDEFLFCTSGGIDQNGCIDCFNQGGGPLCDGAINCADGSGC